MSSLGERAREVRKFYKMTQNEFAEKLGVSREYICRLEKDKESPSNSTLQCFDIFFNVNIDWLITGNGKMFGNLDLENAAPRIRERTTESVIRAIKTGKDPVAEEEIAEAFKLLSSVFHVIDTSNISDGLALILDIMTNLHDVVNAAAKLSRNNNDASIISKEDYVIKERVTNEIIKDINYLFDIDIESSD